MRTEDSDVAFATKMQPSWRLGCFFSYWGSPPNSPWKVQITPICHFGRLRPDSTTLWEAEEGFLVAPRCLAARGSGPGVWGIAREINKSF